MLNLTRSVRFCIPLSAQHDDDAWSSARHNTFAAWPSARGLGAFYELEVCCRGTPDPRTGYVASITTIDRAVREHAIPRIAQALRERPEIEPGTLLPELIEPVQAVLTATVISLTWRLTPHYSVMMESRSMDTVVLRQQFSFAAAHRLHSPHLDDDENRAVFGKCNNRHGHGHNYVLEVAVAVPLGTGAGSEPPLGLPELERIVDETVVQRFDHTNLNLDTAEFADVIPSVEHIARACHELLTEPIDRGGRLRPVTVWETEKTSCTYPA